MQRLDKILSDAGVASRKELKSIIRAGRVTVDGVVIRDPDGKFNEATAAITVDGVSVRKKGPVLLMMHKPAGYVTSTEDPRDPTVMQLLPEEFLRLDVKPVGRLDKETEGLLLFTNHGELAHRIISPKSAVWKTYYAEHAGTADADDIDAFRGGMELRDGTKCLPAELEPLGEGRSIVRVQEGKYHQVRRMMAARNMTVRYLKRIGEGNLTLGDLKKGKTIEISPDQL